MKLTDVTPERLRCGIGACPAVFRSDQGTFVVIGRKIEASVFRSLSGRVGPDEAVIEIPEGLLIELLDDRSGRRASCSE
jgi:hypothetical protein